MPFLTELNVHPIPFTDQRELTSDFAYQRKNGRVILVEKGFVTDYASIPKIIPKWVISADDPIIREGAVIHDYLYQTHKYPRKECDEILIEIMAELGASIPIQILVFFSVRLFGGSHW
jgi:hypothetical protein